MSAVDLYGLERSVYTRVARLALAEKGVEYALHEVEIFGPGGAPPEHLRRHPFGRIPVLEHDGFRLYETAAITRYVDEAFRGPPLQPREPRARARVNQVIGIVDAYAYRPMVWGVFVAAVLHERATATSEGGMAEALAASDRCLAALAAIAECRPYLVGSRPTLADLHAFPVLRCFSLATGARALLERYPALDRWLEAMRARPSVARTRSPHETQA